MKMNWGMIIGLIGGGIGLIVGFAAVISTGSWFALIIMIAVVGFTGSIFWKVLFGPMFLSRRLEKSGIATNAKVVEMSDTGVTLNNQPQVKLLLEVTPPNGSAYMVETKQVISRLQTSMYMPGNMIPVLIDPNDKDKIVINYDGTGGAAGQSYGGSQQYSANTVPTGPWAGMNQAEAEKKLVDIDAKNKEVFAYGRSCKAIVTKYTWLGIYVNGNNPAVEFEVQVLPADTPAFPAKVIGVIQETAIPKYQVGEEIYVKYDPNNLSKITIEHS
ncbi:MAG: hypothetical protein IT280_08440 [Ignavibacteria bacterium]|nr:hypothetical protein [Ignavibacteria bacterium]